MSRIYAPTVLSVVAMFGTVGCKRELPAPSDSAGDAAQASAATQEVPAGDATPALPEAQGPITAPLPADFEAVGILARVEQTLPKKAPAWASIEAEIVEDGGAKYLLATGIARGIRNPALAKTTAENRARATLAKWLGNDQLVGSEPVEAWNDRRRKAVYVRVRIPLPMPETLAPDAP